MKMLQHNFPLLQTKLQKKMSCQTQNIGQRGYNSYLTSYFVLFIFISVTVKGYKLIIKTKNLILYYQQIQPESKLMSS